MRAGAAASRHHRSGPHRRRWPATLTILAVLTMQLVMPSEVTPGPGWVLPVLELALLAPVTLANPVGLSRDSAFLRRSSLTLAAVLSVANAVHLLVLITLLLSGSTTDSRVLVEAAVLIWVTNVAAAALVMWETDRGGPLARDPEHPRAAHRPDLLFPQMSGVSGWDAHTWLPTFADYLFVAFTAATAFSPTDTMPLSVRAKLTMTLTASVSLLTLAGIAARAVNVL